MPYPKTASFYLRHSIALLMASCSLPLVGYAADEPKTSISILNSSTAVQCDSGMIADVMSNADYGNLAPGGGLSTGSNQAIVGTVDESYLVMDNSLTVNGVIEGPVTNTRGQILKSDYTGKDGTYFSIAQDFQKPTDSTTIVYSFRNKFTETSQALNNLTLSIFDIDQPTIPSNTSNIRFVWRDHVSVEGITASGLVVQPEVIFRGSNITSSQPFYQNNLNSVDCAGFSADCQVSVAFKTPVTSVRITYGNVPYSRGWMLLDAYRGVFDNPAYQTIRLKFDGYCYQPQPRITLTKVFSSNRLNDTDQFTVQIKDKSDNTVINDIVKGTTQGTGSTVIADTGTTGIYKVDPEKTYQLTEVASGTANIDNYDAVYECINQKTSKKITTLDPNNIKLTYNDHWACTVTNSPKPYTFSGAVFNDNGGIAIPNQQNISATYTGNLAYFNGKYDPSVETGIPGSTITVSECPGSTSTTNFASREVTVNSSGAYKFNIPAADIGDNKELCFTQIEPDNFAYPVDTTANMKKVSLTAGQITYSDIDFGEVIQENTALVLIKRQYVNDCNITGLASIKPNDTGGPTVGYSTQGVSDIKPGMCIAYRIDAINRGHVPLEDVVIWDALQKQGVDGATVTSTLYNPAPTTFSSDGITYAPTSISFGQNGTVVTNPFDLSIAGSTDENDRKVIFFNTKYGTTQTK